MKKWTSLKDKFPKMGSDVMVSYIDRTRGNARVDSPASLSYDIRYGYVFLLPNDVSISSEDEYNLSRSRYITHWCLLPEFSDPNTHNVSFKGLWLFTLVSLAILSHLVLLGIVFASAVTP